MRRELADGKPSRERQPRWARAIGAAQAAKASGSAATRRKAEGEGGGGRRAARSGIWRRLSVVTSESRGTPGVSIRATNGEGRTMTRLDSARARRADIVARLRYEKAAVRARLRRPGGRRRRADSKAVRLDRAPEGGPTRRDEPPCSRPRLRSTSMMADERACAKRGPACDRAEVRPSEAVWGRAHNRA